MKNLIAHDSLHRVEPTARQQSVSQYKTEVDQHSLNNLVQSHHKKKEETVQKSKGEHALNNSNKKQQTFWRLFEGSEKKKNKEKSSLHSPNSQKHLGGQLFDGLG